MFQSNAPPMGKANDLDVMRNMGKKQEMLRRFNFISILALSTTLVSSWEALVGVFYAGLYNGGPVSLVYGMILSFTGTLAMASSIAEMVSSTPIAGAQYHWTYTYAPKKAAVFMSWMQGWITIFAWQAATAGIHYLAAAQIQGLVVLNYPETYVFQRWHTTLLMWAIALLVFIANVWFIKFFPITQLIAGICHVVFFIVVFVVLLVVSPKASPEFVFTTLISDQSGWNNPGVSWCLGLLTVTWCFTGFDGAIHLSEEVQDSQVTVPRILIWTIVINGIMAFGFMITVLFCVGDLGKALNTPTGFPIIEIFYQATGSKTAATLMMFCVISVGLAATFSCTASVSRLTWAFARDGGFPFSEFFSYVNKTYHLPIRAISLVIAVVILLSFINIGSSTAFNAFISLSTFALYISYIIPISCLILKRLSGEPIARGPWTLGRFGPAINIFAVVYGLFICAFLPFPSQRPVTASNVNYAGPVFGVVLVIAVLDWWARGRHVFVGPRKQLFDDGEEVPSTPGSAVAVGEKKTRASAEQVKVL